jgi:hypothetical protein
LIWNPQTAAPLSARLSVLDTLRRQALDVAWRLLVDILPKRDDISMPTHAPRWRDWKDSWNERVPFEEYRQAMEAVVSRVLEDVGVSGARWSDLLQMLGELPWDQVVKALESTAPDAFSEEDRTMVWHALRSVISNHRRFADEERALPPDVVDRLEGVYERLSPHDPVQRVAWLFAERPDLLEGRPREGSNYIHEIQAAQEDAIHVVREHGGIAGLLRLAHLVKKPEFVGQVVALTATTASGEEQATLLDLLDASDPADRRMAWGYAAKRFDIGQWQWATRLLEHEAQTWSPEKRAAFLRALPFVPETWDCVEGFGEDTERAYWSSAPVTWIDDRIGVERAARLLIRYDRAAHAVYLLGMCLQGTGSQIDSDLAARALEQLLRQGNPAGWGDLAYDIATLLDYLTTSGTVDLSRLAQLEWAFLPLLHGSGRAASILDRELAQSPEFFMEVLCRVFRAHDEAPHESTEKQQAMALLGYRLLDSWRRAPGYRDDGTIDDEVLNAWVDAARTLAAEHRREKIADQQIGRVLSYLPNDSDGLWPHRSVRHLVERIASRDLETGLELGLHNSRGATWRGVTDGGAQERTLQARYLDYAQHLNVEWPRTAAMLRRIARSYAEEGRRHDEEAEMVTR